MTSEEEKGQGNRFKDILEAGEIFDEVTKRFQDHFEKVEREWLDVARRGAEKHLELSRRMEAYEEAWAAELARRMEPYEKVCQSYFESVEESARRISSERFALTDVGDFLGWEYRLIGEQHKAIVILEEMLEEQGRARAEAKKAERTRETRVLILTAIGWGIAIISIAVHVITWWLGR